MQHLSEMCLIYLIPWSSLYQLAFHYQTSNSKAANTEEKVENYHFLCGKSASALFWGWHFHPHASFIRPLENRMGKRRHRRWNYKEPGLFRLKPVCERVQVPVWLISSVLDCMCVIRVATENVTNVHGWKELHIPGSVAGPGDNSAFQLLPIYFIAAALSSQPGQDEKRRCVKKLKWKSFCTQQDGVVGEWWYYLWLNGTSLG